MRVGILVVVLFCLSLSHSPGTDGEPRPLDPAKDFTLPPGFVIERIAGPPVVKHPLHISFDDQGRAYVTDMAGVNRDGKQLEKELPNAIKRLTDTDGDDVFDQATMFADKLTFPGGVLWHEGAVYATAFPYLWKLVDTNGDGVADERTPLVGKFGSIGNAADLHGPQLGPEGWLYFCDGRNGHDLTFADGSKAKGRASGLYRCKPDGSGFERVFAGGMDNPVEVAFTPAGEPLVCANIVISQPRHDAILFGLEGGVYPYDLKAVKELKWTGQYLPMVGDLGWVAVSSLIRYDHTAWGPQYQNQYFTAEFNTHKIRQHTITRDGAGFKTVSAEFLQCTHADFHPTQVVQATDGSLIVVDTGGWFRNGCPTSQVAKPDVLGGIYRIRSQEQAKAGKFATKWQLKLAQEKRSELKDEVEFIILSSRMIPARGESTEHDRKTFMEMLKHPHPAVRREAATQLGRLKMHEAIPVLCAALAETDDPFLEHAIIYSLISIHDPVMTARALESTSPRVRRGALLALDQMGETALSWDQAAPLLQTDDPRLKQATLQVLATRKAWTPELADYLDRELGKKGIDEARLYGLKNLLLALANEPRVQQVVADRLACPEETNVIRVLLLEAMTLADLRAWPMLWTGPLRELLANKQLDDEVLLPAVLAAAASGRREFDAVLRQVAVAVERPVATRLTAAGVAVQDGQPVPTALFRFLLQSCQPDEEPLRRLAAARALGAAVLSDEQLQSMTTLVRKAESLELPLLLKAWERQPSVTTLPALIAALEAAPGLSSVTPQSLAKVLDPAIREKNEAAEHLLLRTLNALPNQRLRIEELKKTLTGGDVGRGRALFFGTKAVCSTCHRIGHDGGQIGPNLSQIGAIRTRNDLLEAIVSPSKDLSRGYETLVVVTRGGKTHTGVLTRETTDALVLTDAQRQEHKVLRRDVEEMTLSRNSTMPNGLDQNLSPEELRDLLAYLMTLKK